MLKEKCICLRDTSKPYVIFLSGHEFENLLIRVHFLPATQIAVEINNNRTELICMQFEDRCFIIVTQYNKVGTLVRITQDNVADETGTGVPMYTTDVLMGKDEPLTQVIARNLIIHLSLHKPILLSVALKDTSPQTVKTLAKILPSLV